MASTIKKSEYVIERSNPGWPCNSCCPLEGFVANRAIIFIAHRRASGALKPPGAPCIWLCEGCLIGRHKKSAAWSKIIKDERLRIAVLTGVNVNP